MGNGAFRDKMLKKKKFTGPAGKEWYSGRETGGGKIRAGSGWCPCPCMIGIYLDDGDCVHCDPQGIGPREVVSSWGQGDRGSVLLIMTLQQNGGKNLKAVRPAVCGPRARWMLSQGPQRAKSVRTGHRLGEEATRPVANQKHLCLRICLPQMPYKCLGLPARQSWAGEWGAKQGAKAVGSELSQPGHGHHNSQRRQKEHSVNWDQARKLDQPSFLPPHNQIKTHLFP